MDEKKNSTFFEKMEPPSSLGSSGRVNAVPGVSVGRFLSLLGVNLAWQNAKFWGNEKLEPVILERRARVAGGRKEPLLKAPKEQITRDGIEPFFSPLPSLSITGQGWQFDWIF